MFETGRWVTFEMNLQKKFDCLKYTGTVHEIVWFMVFNATFNTISVISWRSERIHDMIYVIIKYLSH